MIVCNRKKKLPDKIIQIQLFNILVRTGICISLYIYIYYQKAMENNLKLE